MGNLGPEDRRTVLDDIALLPQDQQDAFWAAFEVRKQQAFILGALHMMIWLSLWYDRSGLPTDGDSLE